MKRKRRRKERRKKGSEKKEEKGRRRRRELSEDRGGAKIRAGSQRFAERQPATSKTMSVPTGIK